MDNESPSLKITTTREMAALVQPGERASQRRAWVSEVTGLADPRIVPASEDASFRSYWRVIDLPQTPVLMDAPPPREDIEPWLAIAARLRAAGLHAPAVLASDTTLGFVLMEDLGDRTYLPALDANSVDGLYGRAMGALLEMQRGIDPADLPLYDASRLRQELELLPQWFVGRHLGVTPERGGTDALDAGFHLLIEVALEQPQVFVHRDYHSRNLLIAADDSPGIIDFQDAVLGPVTYDLVSLLRDCYISWPEVQVAAWAESHRQRLVEAGLLTAGPREFRRWFDWMGVQRHLKVLGIFSRLWYRDRKPQYLADLPRVWGYVRDVAMRYDELSALAQQLERWIDKRDLGVPRR